MLKLSLALALLLPGLPVRAQEDAPEDSAPTSDETKSLGERGIQNGTGERVSGGAAPKSDAPSGGSAGGSSGPCAKEDLDWKPGKGAPAVAVQGQAMRLQAADSTIAYRVRASQLGPSGDFGLYTDSHPGTHMSLTNQACSLAFKRLPCEGDYGSVTIFYLSAATYKTLPKAVASTFKGCVLPAPAGKIGGEDYWWLNIHTKGPCAGGSTWFGGQKVPEGQCPRAVIYSGNGGGATAAPGAATPPPATSKPNTCWKAPSGRQCCDVMFSPVPSECVRR